ncbi:hypothetical protein C4K08_3704 [Pseudomonas chlororaphis subsp. aureofaciens]|nr:hypothetical protein C4K08_3704 [Pseudomonas chlororaphis subsp. aureofaciens]
MYVESWHPKKSCSRQPPSRRRSGAVGYRKKPRARSRFS